MQCMVVIILCTIFAVNLSVVCRVAKSERCRSSVLRVCTRVQTPGYMRKNLLGLMG